MDLLNKMILIKGEPSDDIVTCYYDKNLQKQVVKFKNGKTYNYAYANVEWLNESSIIDKTLYKFTNNDGVTFFDVDKILMFKSSYDTYYRFFFTDGSHRSYNGNTLKIDRNALAKSEISSLLDYFKCVSEKVGLKSDDGTNILKAQFEKMPFLSDESVLAKYLDAAEIRNKQSFPTESTVFPFGCNLSQITAVDDAIASKVSIIEGPPGTGKTQTILNIISNIVMNGQTVAVVSNNNSATDNVFEKLQKYGFDYIVAQLGKSDNKKDFISSKQLPYPDFAKDSLQKADEYAISDKIKMLKSELIKLFENQNRIAELKSNLAALKTEKKYFDDYFSSTYKDITVFRNKAKVSSDRALRLWNECQEILESNKEIGLWFKLKSVLFYGVASFGLYKEKLHCIIPLFKKQFYSSKLAEITQEIDLLQKALDACDFKQKSAELASESTKLFKSSLAKKYRSKGQRITFDSDALWKKPIEFLSEYPVILSTTHSARSSLKGVAYDYVIVDEASQVDLVTGVLAMSCAKNVVIVGDLKQLPNVVKPTDKKVASEISIGANIPLKYRYEENSLLSSVCQVFPHAPRTLLREHYRCHPKIIEFCNQKFYNNNLVILTNDNGEDDVLKVYVTAEGNHAREHFNQRQIDEIKHRVLPELSSNDVGIISPYKDQTSELSKTLEGELDISTVHKFQGREKDDIVISTVDNEISNFTDNPNMLNVAVSRAKNRLRLVVSDNEKNENTNIGDLVKYIKYNNFEIKKSDIFSVFDMLYKGYESTRKTYLLKRKRVSEFDSENLMYTIIEEVLQEDDFSKLDVVIRQPLNAIIRDPHKFTDSETAYAMNDLTHVDFLIYNKIDKSPVLAVEVDGYAFHKDGTRQKERDAMKDTILEKYSIPIIRFNTTQSMEKVRLQENLNRLLTQ